MTTEIVVVGLSHHTAGVEVREAAAIARDRLDESLRALARASEAREAILLSTCNRVEFYAATQAPIATVAAAKSFFRARPRIAEQCLYERRGSDAVRHLFRVSASLDSMVLGEPQILGQVKEAFAAAGRAGTTGAVLDRCFSRAFSVAKRVRTETKIAAGTVSVSAIASELAGQIFGALSGRRVLLVGAGKMSESAARHLGRKGARLVVLNRSQERAESLARACGGEPRPYESLAAELVHADVVVTSTASERFILTTDLIDGVIKARRHRPLFLIDIAVPRNIDPRVGAMENVFLYDMDDLQKVSGDNLAERKAAAASAERLVQEEARAFERWRKGLELTPTIVGLRETFQEIVRAEVARSFPHASREEGVAAEKHVGRKDLDAMTDAIVNKLLHPALTELRRAAESEDGAALIDATRRLFALDATSAAKDGVRSAELEPSAAKDRR